MRVKRKPITAPFFYTVAVAAVFLYFFYYSSFFSFSEFLAVKSVCFRAVWIAYTLPHGLVVSALDHFTLSCIVIGHNYVTFAFADTSSSSYKIPIYLSTPHCDYFLLFAANEQTNG